ncbi:hypothetical protein ABZ128_28575 [Streptomyces sp. NPDC006326]|uniref:hypothetical protein n=1 Tax=Streptomyces sp. NPDC006326 TaxID=3156752 RepID=UPI0033BEE732
MTGCAPADGDARAAASPSAPAAAPVVPTVIGKEQAEKVFNQYVWEHNASMDRRDGAAIAKVETGALLARSLANLEVAKARGSAGLERTFVKPEFFIPAERDQPGYPRSFAVFSRGYSNLHNERAAAVHYFVQEVPGGEWKAAARSWTYDKPLTAQFDDTSYVVDGFAVRDKEIAAVRRDAAGAPALSPTAAEDRTVCGRYAEYLSFRAPNGEPESEHFVPGELTSDVVKAYNEDYPNLTLVRRSFAFEAAAGPELPVLKLADGRSLVTCSFVRTDHWEGKVERAAIFKYGTGNPSADTDALLGGGHKWWKSTDVRRSVTATLEVPAQGPADVVGCNCFTAPVLSAEGTPD